MITPMTKYSFILMSGAKDAFLDQLRELGVVDITRSSKPVDDRSAQLLAEIENKKAEIAVVRKGADDHLAELNAQLNSLMQTRAELEPWGEFTPESLERLAKNGVEIRFYSVQESKFDENWAQDYALQTIATANGKVWFVIAGNAEGFPIKEIAAPAKNAAEAERDIQSKTAEIEAYKAALEARKSELPELEAQMDAMSSELSAYLAGLTAVSAAEDSLAIFEGFAPEEENGRLQKAFDEMDIIWLAEAASAADNPPIKFKNNKFVKMFEVLTDMYGRPAYDGFDPTPFISVFFMLFFAMCMGDLGYGLILVAVGFLLKKVKSFASLAPLVVALGFCTVFVGFFFHTLFSVDFSGWSWIPDGVKKVFVPAQVAGYDGTMVLALIVGIVHLLLAMVVKTIYATRNAGFLNSLSTWGWTLLWVGLAVIGLISLTGVIDTGVAKIAIIVLGIICAIGIFPLNNIHRNPLVNIGSGLWDAYNMATGILGDVLSYLRLYALGLAGAMLGFAFNDLAKMALGGGGFGWVPFVLIVIVGHTLNLAMAALGAFVHPLRLNFLEFFKNSGYEGVGAKYNPLKK